MDDLKELKKIDQVLDACTRDNQVIPIAESLNSKLKNLKKGERLLIPGGWSDEEGGHALIYQFTRGPKGYIFTIINSGSGIHYHAKTSSKSLSEKSVA